MYKKSLLYVGSTVGSKNMSNNQFYSIGWNHLILHHKYWWRGKDLNLRSSGYEFYVPQYYWLISTYIN